MNLRLFAFVGGDAGVWRVARMETVVGEPIPEAKRLILFRARVFKMTDRPVGCLGA